MKLKQIKAITPLLLTTALGLFLALLPEAASAANPAEALASVNLRAGPGTYYPVVVTLPARAALNVYGCLADSSWCDVSWGRSRGWVAASYVQVYYRGARVVVTPAIVPAIGIAVLAFDRAYWDSHYIGRPWYGRWNYYYRPGFYTSGRIVTGSCGNGSCSGTVIRRGPFGGVYVRHGTMSIN
jgi:uncharacterized protein YraI